MPEKIHRVLVFPDVHVSSTGPGHDEPSIRAMLAWAKDQYWDEVVGLGDFLDFDFASRWTATNARLLGNSRFSEEYEHGNAMLDRMVESFRHRNRKAKFTLLEGNHDFRPKKVIEADPRFQGLIDFDVNLKLEKRKIDFHPFWSDYEPYRIGKALFIHGLYTTVNHAKKHVDVYGKSVFYGHVHSIQTHTKVLHGRNGTVVGQSLGCLCEYKQGYIGAKPTDWQHAFGVFHFREGGLYNYYVVQIHDGAFVSPDGELVKP